MMKKTFYLRITVLLIVIGVFLVTGCSSIKETTTESSAQPQNMTNQEPVAPPEQEEMKPAASAKEVAPVTEGEQKVAAAQPSNGLGDIHFDFDKDNLRPQDRKILALSIGC